MKVRPLDRAGLLALNVLYLIETVPDELRLEYLENLLRDELADIERQIAGDRAISDA